MLRFLWPRLCAIALPLLVGSVLWSRVSAKPPLATPPPQGVPTNTPEMTATERPTAMPSSPSTLTPTATAESTATPQPTLPPSPEVVVRSPTPSVEADPSPETHPSVPAVVRLGADERGRYLLVDQATQTMHVFEGWREIRIFPVSTGLPESHTETPEWSGRVGEYVGTFESLGTYQDDGWYLFSHGGSILLHGAPYVVDEAGHKVYSDLDSLGRRPTSHGCIRLAPADAAWLTTWDPQDVPVTITAWPSGEPGQQGDEGEGSVG